MKIRTTWHIQEKLAKKHKIDVAEVEEALNNDDDIYIQKGKFGSSFIYSRTEAGRYLFTIAMVNWQIREAFIVTSRDMTKREKTFYHRKKSPWKKR